MINSINSTSSSWYTINREVTAQNVSASSSTESDISEAVQVSVSSHASVTNTTAETQNSDSDTSESFTPNDHMKMMQSKGTPPPPPPAGGAKQSDTTDDSDTDSLLDELDTNGDGVISLEELAAAQEDDTETQSLLSTNPYDSYQQNYDLLSSSQQVTQFNNVV
jgi:hypothetical protein